MIINRDKYLNELISREKNGLVKIITGVRRSGKSFLLNKIFRNYLMSKNINEKQVISFSFDDMENVMMLDKYLPNEKTLYFDSKNSYRVNPNKFILYIKEKAFTNEQYYLLLDEIQLLDNFVFVLNGFLNHDNYDIYVTGSNSKMLSKDIITEFRGRGDQIHLYPLSFKEYFEATNLTFEKAYKNYQYYGGMPYLLNLNNDNEKQDYLKTLFKEIYVKDIVDKNKLKNHETFEKLFEILSSSIGSYTNPTNLEKTFKSELKIIYGHDAIKNHIEYIKDSFILSEVQRYDIKGKKYIGSNSKYYFTDIGLRNALINFRQDEPTHIMENIIYNELINKGYSVDIGIVEISEKNINNNYVKKQLETDFICNTINGKIYIQSALSMPDREKLNQEKRPLIKINDNFRKIIITKEDIKPYVTEDGIEIIPLEDFLLKGIE